ncbi:MAG: 4-hydroxyphenylpyruvate dioxygenase [Bdellovibrionota bacterium]
MKNAMGISGFDYVEFYVGSAKMAAYWYQRAFGMKLKAFRGMETGDRKQSCYYLEKNQVKIVLTSAIDPGHHEIQSFLQTHGDGVKRVAYRVQDVSQAYAFACQRGAISVRKPYELRDEYGVVHEASIRVFDDTEIVFVDAQNYRGVFRPGYMPYDGDQVHAQDTGLEHIDHIVGNVRTNEMDKWAEYFEKTMDFETFVDFGPGDISTQYSALLSKVVRSKDGVIKHPINEPYPAARKSQIQEYVEEYHGSGVQHIAIETRDILASIRALKANGVEFLTVPSTYYELMRQSGKSPEEGIDAIEELGILCDFEDVTGGKGYLLQLFTKPIGDRPSFFFEIIQRKGGSQGFGKGNFQALFESIELDQQRRGNL